jgi:DNA-binding NarL/FixJ family response regulator
MITAILVEDHEIYRLGLKSAFEKNYPDITIVAEAETGNEFFSLLKVKTADIVLLDIGLPDMSGVEVARRLKKEKPEMKILVTSTENTEEVIKELVEMGIDGFISKRQGGVQALVEAIHSIMRGLEYFGKDIADIIYKIYVSKKRTTEVTIEFSDKERQIIELCREGLQSKQIADRLELSPRTVENHKTRIFHKLGINNTVEMLQYALKHGIINV